MVKNYRKLLPMVRGEQPAELVLKNGNVVNVFTGRIEKTDIAVAAGVIIGLGSYTGEKELDLQGRYVVPGFIDAHVHIESSMVSPTQFSRAVIPRGTTTVVADPHELANVYGIKAIQYLIEVQETVPLDIYVMLPSCVPATNLETSGANLGHKELEQFLDHPRVLGLGEMMNYPGVALGDEEVWQKLGLVSEKGKVVDGHLPVTDMEVLNAFSLGRIKSNHECTTPEEARACLSQGMRVMLREGTAAKNLVDLLAVVDQYTLRYCMLCTDDRHPTDIIQEGHIDHLVRLCIKNGLSPVTAIQLATINAAEYFGLQHLGAIAPGYQADLLIVDDLAQMEINQVYKKGILVAERGEACYEAESEAGVPEMPVGLKLYPLDPQKIKLEIPEKARVIELVPGQILTRHAIIPGDKCLSKNEDIIKLVVAERHQWTGNVGVGLVKGFGLKNGAIASTVAHDSHNLIVAGDNDSDILLAVEELIRIKGGLAVVSQGKVLASLALPLGGLMSFEPVEQVVESLRLIKSAVAQLGVPEGFDPFMTLAFLSLPVIPELRLTDQGLVDVAQFCHVAIDAD